LDVEQDAVERDVHGSSRMRGADSILVSRHPYPAPGMGLGGLGGTPRL
jgi:hypothetical protein